MKKMKMEKRLIGVYALIVLMCIIIYFATESIILLALGFIALLGTGFQFLRYWNAKKEVNQS
ncbi:hypothetical protein HB837_15140 [Listeria innocua]|uniref:hypothetical protein n=1 Tax=Listeria TaxID=1637 RepID=UPI0011EB6D14|nr:MULTISPECIES: hypothetical protein [Listeria]EHK4067830.1 hypothetical protein [Listeria monocytogenes]MBC1339517.1 hypothetical protein [Listeria innocua]MBC1353745.1 hypothetical protein [Listeria innocua]MBC2238760.1 hypothetical protein [Listeria innocua]TYV00438.1 hypothetical protein FZ054_15685 [Listeria monocytogenes]